MVCFRSLIPVDQHIAMAKSVAPIDPYSKLKQINHLHRNRKANNNSPNLSFPACDQSRSAVVDVVILIAVICACGFLIFPYLNLVLFKTVEILGVVVDVVREEVMCAPMVYGCLGLSILCAVVGLLAISVCASRRCGKPDCRGLRKGAEFDIQLETEECVKYSNGFAKDGIRTGLFELPRDHHRELEQELKKMAPPNGRAVLVFRARCGCSVGRMEVPGPRKTKKVKK